MSILKNGIMTGYEFNESLSNFTKVGSPTITPAGVIDNFSTSNYIVLPCILPTNKSIEISIRKIVTSDILNSTRELGPIGVYGASSLRNFDCSWYLLQGTIVLWINASASSFTSVRITNNIFKVANLQLNDVIDIVCSRDVSSSTYTIKARKNNGDWVINYISSSLDLVTNNSNVMIGGGLYQGDSTRVDIGQTDLFNTYIAINNKVIYSPAVNKASISSYQITATDFYEV